MSKVKLAQVDDPLVLADGQIIQPDPITSEVDVRPSQVIKAHEFRPARTRSMRDLPVDHRQMRGIAYIFVLTVLGVGDAEIAHSLDLPVSELRAYKESEAYSEIFATVTDEFVNVNSKLLKSRIAAYSHAALGSLADVALHSKNDALRGRFSADLLDRAGAGKKGEGTAGNVNNELRIVINSGGSKAGVTLDLNGETIDA